ncbi:glycosyltransferase [Pectobacteriaceae bacterium CE70]|nr:glycosyltransferase [Pectobacteriaceae bacterium C52]WJV67610.1 glycosyltransferase [Pectobacteriaceae bacterium CE70]
MTFVSYAKNFEDVILKRALKQMSKGFYIDIGAAQADIHSVTNAFYKEGWHGVNIDPNTDSFNQLVQKRPKDVNLNIAILDKKYSDVPLYVFKEKGISTFEKGLAKYFSDYGFSYKTYTSSSLTLKDIWKKYVPQGQEVHFLSISVENTELQVIEGNDWERNRPWIVVVQTVDPLGGETKSKKIEDAFQKAGYDSVCFNGVNRFYLAHEKRELAELLTLPSSVLDEFVPVAEFEKANALVALSSAIAERDEARAALNAAIAERDEYKVSVDAIAIERDQFERDRHFLLHSRSWLITKFLRELSLFVKTQKTALRNNMKSIIIFSYKKARNFPYLLNIVKKILSMSPRIEIKIRRLVSTYRQNLILPCDNIKIKDGHDDHNVSLLVNGLNVRPIQKKIVFIYVDFTCRQDSMFGITRVVTKLTENLCNLGETVVPVKLSPDTLRLAPLSEAELENFKKIANIKLNSLSRHLLDKDYFDQVGPHLKSSPVQHWLLVPEVTYHTYHSVPVTSRLIKCARDWGLKVGSVFYDHIPLTHESASSNALKHMRYLSDLSLSDIIWPISDFSGRELHHYYAAIEKLSTRETPVISANNLPEADASERQVFDWSSTEKIILSLGSICLRKNQLTLVRAFNAYCHSHPETEWKLALVGQYVEPEYMVQVQNEARKNKRICIYNEMNDADLDLLYKKVAFTVFASTNEGYGLPIVESLWRLRPCICAANGAMLDLARHGGCVTVDVTDQVVLQSAVEKLIVDRSFYDAKIGEIIRRPMRSWSEYAQQIINETNRPRSNLTFDGVICVWVDATIASSGNSGIQRVTRQLCRTLIEAGHRLVPVKWDEKRHCVTVANDTELAVLAAWNGPDPKRWLKELPEYSDYEPIVYLLSDLPLNRDLSFQQEVIQYFKEKSAHCCSIFYDAIPLIMDDIYPQPFVQAMQQYMKMLDQMDQVFSISESSNDDLYRFLNIKALKGLALEQRLKAVCLPEQYSASSRIKRPVLSSDETCNIICVSTVEPRKNHLVLLQAFLDAEKKSPRKLKLTLIGSGNTFDTTLKPKVNDLIAQSENIEWIQDADDQKLSECYQSAHFTVYPSVREGFGLPIVESLWFGRPCICANFGQMAELLQHGGCYGVNVHNADEIRDAIIALANNGSEYQKLVEEALNRHFKTWDQYAEELVSLICEHTSYKKVAVLPEVPDTSISLFLPERPKLSVCITTYNRKKWLAINIENFISVSAGLEKDVELIICDNCSHECIDDLIAKYHHYSNITFYQNSANIGMLNNLPQTVSFANGEYVWLIGDDDLIHKDALQNILDIIKKKSPDLINLNYNVSSADVPESLDSLDEYLDKAQNYTLDGVSKVAPIREISSRNENYYTAIYSFVARRNFSWRIFNQDTSGAPFSSMQTCVPSSKYILSKMMEEKGYWLNKPAITINLKVSWGEHASIWLLERIPEVYDLAELNGAPEKDVSHWRDHTFRNSIHCLDLLQKADNNGSYPNFSFARYLRRNRGVDSFETYLPIVKKSYQKARDNGIPFADLTEEEFATISTIRVEQQQ